MARIDASDDQPLAEINPSQLTWELGGVGLRVVQGKFVETVEDFDQAALAAAVAAHVLDVDWVDPDYVPPAPPPTVEEQVAALPNPAIDFAGFKAALAELLA